ncbi:hypothetical protein JW711_03515 [Candidatus Woesearchaeota archaeon]|nr:hypothetical protein [Candidatus Woesearchaeota archaeon]
MHALRQAYHQPLHSSHTATHEKTVEKTVETETHQEDEVEIIVDKVLKVTCVIALILWFIGVIVLSLITDSGPFYTFLGFSPALLTIVVTYVLVDKYHMESGFLMVFPFIFTGLFLVLGLAKLLGPLDYLTLSTINIVIGLLFEAILVLQHAFVRHEHARSKEVEETTTREREHETSETESKVPVEKKEIVIIKEKAAPAPKPKPASKPKVAVLDTEDDVKKFVASIEDKAKAINAVIGRVYSVRRGGTESMRKKIRVDAEHYNEFTELKDETPARRKAAAVRLLKKIQDTLLVSTKKESEVFDLNDLTGLLKLDRDPYGNDKIIDVLAKNDSDPVKNFHEGALQFCEEALSDLGFVQEHLDKIAEGSPPKDHKPTVSKPAPMAKSASPAMHQLSIADSGAAAAYVSHIKQPAHKPVAGKVKKSGKKRLTPRQKEKKKHKDNMKKMALH